MIHRTQQKEIDTLLLIDQNNKEIIDSLKIRIKILVFFNG